MFKKIKYLLIIFFMSFGIIYSQSDSAKIDSVQSDSTKLKDLQIKYQDASKYLEWLKQQELAVKATLFDINETYMRELQSIEEKKKAKK